MKTNVHCTEQSSTPCITDDFNEIEADISLPIITDQQSSTANQNLEMKDTPVNFFANPENNSDQFELNQQIMFYSARKQELEAIQADLRTRIRSENAELNRIQVSH